MSAGLTVMAAMVAVFMLRGDPGGPKPATDFTPEELTTILDGTQKFLVDEGACPGSVMELSALGYVDAAMDRWGNVYELACAENRIVVTSSGPDEAMGTEDDQTAARELQQN